MSLNNCNITKPSIFTQENLDEIVTILQENHMEKYLPLVKLENIDLVDKDWNTLLHHASRRWILKLVDLLLNCWADINKKNGEWLTPLVLSAFSWNYDTVERLHSAGAQNPSDALVYARKARIRKLLYSTKF